MIDLGIRDIPRGTSLVIPVTVEGDVIGSRVGFVIRPQRWSSSADDTDATVNIKINFRSVDLYIDLSMLEDVTAQDLVLVEETGIVYHKVAGVWSVFLFGPTDFHNGKFPIVVPAASTRVDPGRYYYSLDIKRPTGLVEKIARGSVRISANTVNEI